MKTSAVPSASANSEETGATAKTFRDQLRAKRKPLDAAQPSAGPSRLAVALPIKAAPLPVAKHIPPTDPKPFRFVTDSRIRPKTSESDSKAVFSKMLRTYPNAPPTAVNAFEGIDWLRPRRSLTDWWNSYFTILCLLVIGFCKKWSLSKCHWKLWAKSVIPL